MMRPVSIEARDIHKSFRIKDRRQRQARASGLRRLVGPLNPTPTRTLDVLKGISFDVHQGEFFGVIGRNGSGKSTLLKILCGVYGADSGTVRVAGRMAPFLELGIGFNPSLAAHENIVLNGVMMGLSPDEARRRSDEIIDFAGLREYTDVELNNYSSGMRVRLGFAVMTHVDADVLLIDEVLAVGDAEFQERCGETFVEMHEQGRTIVLVTHSVAAVASYCDRALIIEDGRIDLLGDPEEVGARYLEINVGHAAQQAGSSESAARLAEALADPPATITELVLPGLEGGGPLPDGEPLRLHGAIRFDRAVPDASVELRISTAMGMTIHNASSPLGIPGGAGSSAEFEFTVSSPLRPGRYQLGCTVTAPGPEGMPEARSAPKPVAIDVEGPPRLGFVELDQELEVRAAATAQGPGGAER